MSIADIAKRELGDRSERVHREELDGEVFEFTYVTDWPVERYERLIRGDARGPIGEALADGVEHGDPRKEWLRFKLAFEAVAGRPLTHRDVDQIVDEWAAVEGVGTAGNSRGSDS